VDEEEGANGEISAKDSPNQLEGGEILNNITA
jgi:hypothetical protein